MPSRQGVLINRAARHRRLRKTMDTEIKTPETHPDHHTVGHFFKSWPHTYYCDSYDPRIGYWMTNVDDPADRRNVSERAIGRTFHEIYSDQELAEAKVKLQQQKPQR